MLMMLSAFITMHGCVLYLVQLVLLRLDIHRAAAPTFIAGAVKGNIDVKGPVVIDSTAVIIGDIKSQTLQINSGATIDGRCTQCYSEINTAQIFEKKEEAADDNLQEAVAEKESQPEPEQRNIDDVLDNIAAGKMSSSADIKDEYVNTLEK